MPARLCGTSFWNPCRQRCYSFLRLNRLEVGNRARDVGVMLISVCLWQMWPASLTRSRHRCTLTATRASSYSREGNGRRFLGASGLAVLGGPSSGVCIGLFIDVLVRYHLNIMGQCSGDRRLRTGFGDKVHSTIPSKRCSQRRFRKCQSPSNATNLPINNS